MRKVLIWGCHFPITLLHLPLNVHSSNKGSFVFAKYLQAHGFPPWNSSFFLTQRVLLTSTHAGLLFTGLTALPSGANWLCELFSLTSLSGNSRKPGAVARCAFSLCDWFSFTCVPWADSGTRACEDMGWLMGGRQVLVGT